MPARCSVHGGGSAGGASSGGCSRRPSRALPAPTLGRLVLGFGSVQLQSLAAGLFHPLADFGLDRAAPLGRKRPQHQRAIGNNNIINIIVARRLRLDQPLDVVALERQLSARLC